MNRRCMFMTEIRNSFDLYITNKGGPKQREYERVAQIIIQFTTKVFKIRISKLVLDFVQDEQRIHYLVGVPSFEIDKYENYISNDPTKSLKPHLSPWEIFEDKSALVYCKL